MKRAIFFFTFKLVAERAGFVLIEHDVFGLELLPGVNILSYRRGGGGGGGEAHGCRDTVSHGASRLAKAIGEWLGEPHRTSMTEARGEYLLALSDATAGGGGKGGSTVSSDSSAEDCESVNPSHRH